MPGGSRGPEAEQEVAVGGAFRGVGLARGQPREPLGGHIVRGRLAAGPLQQEQANHRVVEVIVAGHPVDRPPGRLRP